jgi:hypothetical protein
MLVGEFCKSLFGLKKEHQRIVRCEFPEFLQAGRQNAPRDLGKTSPAGKLVTSPGEYARFASVFLFPVHLNDLGIVHAI